MSANRITLDSDILTVRQVNALLSNNAKPQANRVLTTDGAGGTFWANLSTLNTFGFGAYNNAVVNNTALIADLSYNRLGISSGSGIGLSVNTANKYFTVFGKSFTQIDVSGGNTVVAYSNNTATPTLKLAARAGVSLSSDPLTNTIFITGIPSSIASGIYAYNTVKVISNMSTPSDIALGSNNYNTLTAGSATAQLTLAGTGDILLSTKVASNAYFVSISTFTSKGYLDMSGVAYGTLSSACSSISTLFYDTYKISSATSSLKSMISNISVNIDSRFVYDEQNVLDNYVTKDKYGIFSSFTLTTLSNVSVSVNYVDGTQFSSLRTTGYNTTNNGEPDPGGITAVKFSTVNFRLDAFSSVVQRGNRLSVVYYPSAFFDANQQTATLFYMSTMIQAGQSYLNSGRVVRPWVAHLNGQSNYWADQCQLYLDPTELANCWTSTFSMVTRITPWNLGGFATSTIINTVFDSNCLNIRIN